MNKMIKRVCLTLMVALLGVVSLMKADSVNGASPIIITNNNMINVLVEDQYGNKITSGILTLYAPSGKVGAKVDLSTGKLASNPGYYYQIGQRFLAFESSFQKYIKDGTVIGLSETTEKRPGDFVYIETTPSIARVWYKPDKTDYVLPANSIAVYIDPAWKNTSRAYLYVAYNKFVFTEDTGLFCIETSNTENRGSVNIGNGGSSFTPLISTSTPTEYFKRRIKLTELNSNIYSDDGYFVLSDRKVPIGSSNPLDCAVLIFVSGGMVTIPMPDSEGYVEVYVQKNAGKINETQTFYQNSATGGGSDSYSGYPYVDMTVQGITAPTEGYNICDLNAGKYTIELDLGKNYALYKSNPIEVKNSDSIQEIKIVVHKHNFSSKWTSDGNNHWNTCACGEKNNLTSHTYSSWLIDREATEELAGQKHRICTVCNYKQTVTIDKLSHVHKHSTEWSFDASKHWYECPCGDKKDLASHASSTEATETTAKTCDKCGYIMEPATGHIKHIADKSKYFYNEDTHWYQCIGCNLKMEETAHNFEWVIDVSATEDLTGQKHEECTYCGYKKETVEIPQIIKTESATNETENQTKSEIDETENQTQSETTTEETKPQDAGLKKAWIVVAIVAIVIIIILILIILRKKKKEDNEQNK